METYRRLGHTPWECKYHVVFIPKCRRKALFYQLRQHLGAVFRDLASHKECFVEEGHIMADHVHILISISPKRSFSEVIGYIKGKSAIWIARNVNGRERNFYGQSFWARGYFVSTVGRDEQMIRDSIRKQEHYDKNDSQGNLPGLGS